MSIRSRSRRRRPGSTLIELMAVVTMAGILATMAIPSFRRAIEQTKVDQAAATLRTIWAAERLYRLEQGQYAHDDPTSTAFEKLCNSRLIDRPEVDTNWFRFAVIRASEGGLAFEVEARRVVADGSTPWTGTLRVDANGCVSGCVEPRGLSGLLIPEGEKERLRLKPSYIFRGAP